MKQSFIRVHLDRLAANVRAIREAVSDETTLIQVVKSDAYGHGLDAVVRTCHAEGVGWFAVAHLGEALRVRKLVPDSHILLLGTIEPGDVVACAQQGITPLLVDPALAPLWAAEALRAGVSLPVHIKVDTGMGRLGWDPSTFEANLAAVAGLSGLSVTGICSHLATVEPEGFRGGGDPALAQAERFATCVGQAEALLGRRLFRHLSSSRAAQYYRDLDLDGIRPGIVSYGYGSSDLGMRIQTRPCLEWRAPLAQVRSVPAGFPVGYYSTWHTKEPTTLGVLAVGYADGLLRALSNQGHVLVRGRRCPLVGRVSMNLATIDLGPDSTAQTGDSVVLIGEDSGESIWADQMARSAGTIAYEILTAIDRTLPREYVGGESD